MNINLFMERGISGLIKTAVRFYLSNKKGRDFMAAILPEIHTSSKIRKTFEKNGTHVPPFLIASITSQCNLRCAGCYARAGGCHSTAAAEDMSAAQWQAVFSEASGLGVSFILMAGGEPLLRPDVIDAASSVSNIIFPIFTNGTMIDDKYTSLFDSCRNLIPVISIEGGADATDRRRGGGVYAKLDTAMSRLRNNNILFGVSVTVTRENLREATSEEFISELRAKGCGLVFFVEYVPVDEGTESLALGEEEARKLNDSTASLRNRYKDMILISFPGDEAEMGGCLASGRGFFHVNSNGGAEPCPFSPFSKHNLKTDSIKDVLGSDFFYRLRGIAAEAGPHAGGCTLFDRKEKVHALYQSD